MGEKARNLSRACEAHECFLHTWFICCCRFNWLSIRTPKYVTSFTPQIQRQHWS